MNQEVKEIADLIYDKTGISVPVEVIRFGGRKAKKKFKKNVVGVYNRLDNGSLAGEFVFNDYRMDEIMENTRQSIADTMNLLLMFSKNEEDAKIRFSDPERDERVQQVEWCRKKYLIMGFGFYLHDIHQSLNIDIPVKEDVIQPYRVSPVAFADTFSEYILGGMKKNTKAYKCMNAIVKTMCVLQEKESTKQQT